MFRFNLRTWIVCGNALGNGAVLSPGGVGDCNSTCAGNFSEFCGAPSKLDVYTFGPPPSSSSSSISSSASSTSVSASISSSITVSSSAVGSTPAPAGSTSSSAANPSSTPSSASAPSSTSSSASAASSTSSSASAPSSTSSSASAPSSASDPPSSSLVPSSTSSSSAQPTQTGPVHVPAVGPYTWIGCYTEATNSRALTSANYINYTTMTIQICEAFCSSPVQYTYFGVEYAGECYCGNTLQAGSVITTTSACSMLCDGSNLEYCGAGNRLDVIINSSSHVVIVLMSSDVST